MRLWVPIALWLCWSTLSLAGATASLDTEMHRLGVRSALVIASQAVDDHPVWSARREGARRERERPLDEGGPAPPAPREGHLARQGTHRRRDVADQTSPIAEAKIREWEKSSKHGDRRVATRAGLTVELKQAGLGTQFVLAPQTGSPKVLWTSSVENCHGLALSPDERMVAFVCEQNGVIVAAL